jgi:MFS family permease
LTGAAASRRRGIAAAIACISIVGVGLSLTIPLLSLALERRGVGGFVIGLHTAAQAAASVLVAFRVPRLVATFGPRPLLLTALVTATAAILAFPAIPEPLFWLPMRMVLGVCLTVLFTVSEYWITGVADPRNRGFVMGVYATVLSIGFAAGPAILTWAGSEGWTPFVIGAVIFVAGLAPVLLGGGAVPPQNEGGHGPPPLRAVLIASPSAVLAAFFFGAAETANFAVLVIWGQRAGLPEGQAALLLTTAFLGNVAFQIPLGMLADRVDKRALLLACALVGTAGALAAPVLVGQAPSLFATMFVWGGLLGGLYTVGLSLLAERFPGPALAAANAAFVMNYSLGSLVGPPLAGAAMEAFNPHGFAFALAALCAVYSGVVARRMVQARSRPPTP